MFTRIRLSDYGDGIAFCHKEGGIGEPGWSSLGTFSFVEDDPGPG